MIDSSNVPVLVLDAKPKPEPFPNDANFLREFPAAIRDLGKSIESFPGKVVEQLNLMKGAAVSGGTTGFILGLLTAYILLKVFKRRS